MPARRALALRLWGLSFASAAMACAQGKVSDFLGVKSWHGTVKITGSGSGSTKGGPISDVWQYGITTNLTFQLDRYDPNIQGWTGTFEGTSNINAKDVASLGSCDQTFTQTFEGKVGGGSAFFTLLLQGTNQYVFYPSVYEAQGATSTAVLSCAPGAQGGTGPATFSPVLSDKIQTLPASGLSLRGSLKVKMDSPMQPLSLMLGGSPAQIDATVEWDIQPGAADEAELVVQDNTEYKSFRPTAGQGGTRGNGLTLTAKLQAKGGGVTNVKAAYFTWEFTDCSHLPGYAMNAPISSPSGEFDLKLESGPDILTVDPAGQKAQTRPGQYTQTSITMGSYDWGGWGKVKVTAYTADGKQFVGYLEGDSSQTEVRVPKRPDSSIIADNWKQNHGVAGLADANDNENFPVGDSNAGDGLSLYEEYRGFIIDGRHVEGNPRKKDYFIVNRTGANYLSALRLFKDLSGLEVHYTLKQSELDPSRLINPNHGNTVPHRDQHGIILVPIAANAGYAAARGGPGTPKSITQVITPAILPTGFFWWYKYLNLSLVHELFHACNVWHHGDGPSQTVSWVRTPGTDTVIENGSYAVTVLEESGGSAVYRLPEGVKVDVTLGIPGDPHVGPDYCVMRYDEARGYPDGATMRYFYDQEEPGYSICHQAEGTGINDSGRSPRARYGDSAPGRGKCQSQILVNDSVPAPRR